MTTTIGKNILTEYVNETNERIENDKNKIRISQVFSNFHVIWSLTKLAINLFFFGFLVLGVVVLLSLDSSSLEIIRNATNEELVSGIRALLFIFIVIMSLIVGITITFLIGLNNYVRDKKEERVEAEQRQTELIKTIVEVNEELLRRHKLVSQESNQ